MRWLISDLARGLIRWAVGIVIGAVCIVWNFAPAETLASWFGHAHEWIANPLTRLVVLVVGLAIIGALLLVRREPKDQAPLISTPDAVPFADSYGDIRVADYPAVLALFKDPERDKLIPLLEAEKISAWGRKPLGNPPPTKIPGTIWTSHYLFYLPRDEEGINQTYVRPNNKYETIFFDVHLNKIQIERIWPGVAEATPLEIIFDSVNPGKKFWSIEQMKDENGKPMEGSYWEYRAIIKNKSAKTLRNVKVTVEAIGSMPRRPEPSYFDINKKALIDLTPGDETLAIIRRWYHPHIVAGMVIGEGVYGPIKMTASADDVPPASKKFQFDPSRNPMREPAIYEMR